MNIHSWQVFTWPTVRAKVPELINAARSFRHLGTSLQLDANDPELCSGSTVWAVDINGNRLGIAWEWVAVRPRVVAMGDPMMLLANLDLVDAADESLPDSQRLLRLHQVIFGLPWQNAVHAARWPEMQRMAA